jgi:hypothetical protein
LRESRDVVFTSDKIIAGSTKALQEDLTVMPPSPTSPLQQQHDSSSDESSLESDSSEEEGGTHDSPTPPAAMEGVRVVRVLIKVKLLSETVARFVVPKPDYLCLLELQQKRQKA